MTVSGYGGSLRGAAKAAKSADGADRSGFYRKRQRERTKVCNSGSDFQTADQKADHGRSGWNGN